MMSDLHHVNHPWTSNPGEMQFKGFHLWGIFIQCCPQPVPWIGVLDLVHWAQLLGRLTQLLCRRLWAIPASSVGASQLRNAWPKLLNKRVICAGGIGKGWLHLLHVNKKDLHIKRCGGQFHNQCTPSPRQSELQFMSHVSIAQMKSSVMVTSCI